VPDQKPEIDTVVRDIVKLYRDITARRLPEYERAIGLTSANQEFREKVIEAVSTCMFQHILPGNPRRSQIRKQLLAVGDAARKAHDSLCNLDAALSAPELSELQLLERHWGVLGGIARRFIPNEVSWLRNASSLADIFAKVFIDKGGRPEMGHFASSPMDWQKQLKSAPAKERR